MSVAKIKERIPNLRLLEILSIHMKTLKEHNCRKRSYLIYYFKYSKLRGFVNYFLCYVKFLLNFQKNVNFLLQLAENLLYLFHNETTR